MASSRRSSFEASLPSDSVFQPLTVPVEEAFDWARHQRMPAGGEVASTDPPRSVHHFTAKPRGSSSEAEPPEGATFRMPVVAAAEAEAPPPLMQVADEVQEKPRAEKEDMYSEDDAASEGDQAGNDDEGSAVEEEDPEEDPEEEEAPSDGEAIASAGPQGLDEYGEAEKTAPCHLCGRTFNLKALQRHMKICEKVFVKKRKQFDMAAQRRPEGEENNAPVGRRRGGAKAKAKAASAAEPPENKWRKKSEAFRDAMRAARQAQAHIAAGKPLSELPPPPPTAAEMDDRIQCPHCGRRFCEEAANKHIPKCKEAKAKLKAHKR